MEFQLDDDLIEQIRQVEEIKRKKPKVQKTGIIFDSANYQLEKKKARESQGSDKQREKDQKK